MNKNEILETKGTYFKNMNRKFIVTYFSYNVPNNFFFNLNFLFHSYISMEFVTMLARSTDCISIHNQQERYKIYMYNSFRIISDKDVLIRAEFLKCDIYSNLIK